MIAFIPILTHVHLDHVYVVQTMDIVKEMKIVALVAIASAVQMGAQEMPPPTPPPAPLETHLRKQLGTPKH